MTPLLKHEMVKELGDVLWYLTALALELNVNLEDVAKSNVKSSQTVSHAACLRVMAIIDNYFGR